MNLVKKIFSVDITGILIRSIVGLIVFFLMMVFRYSLAVTIIQLGIIFFALSIFIVTWNAQRFITNRAFLLLGIGYLFVGLFELQSFFAREPLRFYPLIDLNRALQFWLIGKLFGGITFILAPGFTRRMLNSWKTLGLYAAAAIVMSLSVYYWREFPVCLVRGVGITPAGVLLGAVISFLFGTAVYLFWVYRKDFDKDTYHLLTATALFQFPLGLLFTLEYPAYLVYFSGVLLNLLGLYLLYLAIVEMGLKRPQEFLFRSLEESEEVKRQRDFLKLLFAAERDAILVYDRATEKIVDANDAASENYLFSHEELLGRDISELWADPESARDCINEEIEKSNRRIIEVWEKRKDGTAFPAEISVGTFQVGEQVFICKIARDITETEQLKSDLLRKNQELTDFTYRVSHDLKSPLLIINEYLTILREEPEEREAVMQALTGSVLEINGMIDSLLDLSRAGRLIEVREGVDLAEVVNLAFHSVSVQGVPVRLEIRCDESFTFDPKQMKQVFINLITNSVEHRDPEKAELVIEVTCERRETGFLIEVRDNGSGIEEEFLEKIFETGFTRKKIGGQKGTGFGLAIARKIVEAHGGRIRAMSPGKSLGAVFVIELPG